MLHSRFNLRIISAIAMILTTVSGEAGTAQTTTTVIVEPVAEFEPFTKGTREFDFTAGYLVSPVADTGRTTLNYARQDIRLGWMLNTPSGDKWYRGNFEFLINAFAAEVTKGPGSWMAGGRLLLRYNFVQPGARWVPFFQIGGGGLGNNIHRDQSQRLIGSGFEFTLVGDIGIRYLINPRWAIVATANFEHISNADSASRNVGVNAAGGMIGIATFF